MYTHVCIYVYVCAHVCVFVCVCVFGCVCVCACLHDLTRHPCAFPPTPPPRVEYLGYTVSHTMLCSTSRWVSAVHCVTHHAVLHAVLYVAPVQVTPLSWPQHTVRRVLHEALHSSPVSDSELATAAAAVAAEAVRLGRFASFSCGTGAGAAAAAAGVRAGERSGGEGTGTPLTPVPVPVPVQQTAGDGSMHPPPPAGSSDTRSEGSSGILGELDATLVGLALADELPDQPQSPVEAH
jgi:hypothetical protein